MKVSSVDVAAAVIVEAGKILAARRRPGLRLGGYWEFPGGKIEPGETPQQCLARELLEELGVTCRIGPYLGQSVYDYGESTIRLLAYRACRVGGTFTLTDHDQLLWLSPQQLPSLCWAPADIPLVATAIESLSAKISCCEDSGPGGE